MTAEGSNNRLRLYQWIAAVGALQAGLGGLLTIGVPLWIIVPIQLVLGVVMTVLSVTRAYIDQSPAQADELLKGLPEPKPYQKPVP